MHSQPQLGWQNLCSYPCPLHPSGFAPAALTLFSPSSQRQVMRKERKKLVCILMEDSHVLENNSLDL